MTPLRQTAATEATFTIASMLDDWSISLRAQGKSDGTITSYLMVARSLDGYLEQTGMPRAVASIKREHVEAWLAAMADKAPATRAKCYRSAQQLFRWLIEEGEVTVSPMVNMRPPKVPDKQVPLLTDEQVAALLKACAGTHFEGRRDTALVRLLLDTGCRASEVIGLRVEDVDLVLGTVQVTGKGGHERVAAIGPKTCEAVRRYLRTRTKEGRPAGGALWLGKKGPLTDSGLRQLLERRAADAGIAHLHPHMFRHLFAHRWLSAGGTEGDLMALAGWRSRQMLLRYGSSAAAARAVEAHKRLGLGEI